MRTGKKNIALIIPGGIGTGNNNIGVPVLERIVKLLATDFNVTVFSLFKVNPSYKQTDFTLISLPGKNSFLKIIKLIYIFSRHHRKKKFLVVHGFWALPSGFFAVIIGKIFRIKSAVSILGGDAISLPEINYGQLQRWLPRKVIMWTLQNAGEVISLTDYLAKNLRVLGLQRDIKIIPWGIDIDTFKFQPKVVRQPVRFLHIANLSPVKDQITLLKAFKIICAKVPSMLTIIGEGSLEPQIKQLVKELGLQEHVRFLGVLPYEELPVHYAQANFLLHTSLSEGQSEVVTEAMSSGVIVCGTNVGLIYDLPTCSLGVPVKNFEMLGQEVLKLLADSPRQDAIRKNALTWSTLHSIHWTVGKMTELYSN